jgi:CRP-like cAMP-binding protein
MIFSNFLWLPAGISTLDAQFGMSTEATVRKNTQVVGKTMESQVVRPGERTNFEGKPIANAILLSIPDEEFAMIRDGLHYLDLPHYTVLHEPRTKLEYAYFLNTGMASLVFNTKHRESVEVGVIGNEGFAPIPVAAGIRHSPHEAIMQVSGDGFQLPVDTLQDALKRSPQLQKLLSRYATVHGLQAAQTAGCNRLHDLEQRLARWLLLIQDRVGSGLLRITHEFLATMLGTDRPSVSLAAGGLRKKHIIEYSHGTVKVLNRKKLEGSACECYGLIQQFNAEMAK